MESDTQPTPDKKAGQTGPGRRSPRKRSKGSTKSGNKSELSGARPTNMSGSAASVRKADPDQSAPGATGAGGSGKEVTNAPGSPLKPMKKYVSTVSYLRPATESKSIQPKQQRSPKRLQSAGHPQGQHAGGKVGKKRAALLKAINNPLNSVQNIKSIQTRATNLSAQERERDVVSTDGQTINIESKPGREIPAAIYTKQNQGLADTVPISLQSLQEGDMFDRDIRRIMAIINGVEQEFSEKKISKNFQTALNNAYKRRILQNDHDSTVTETLQQSHYPHTASRQRDHRVIMPNTYATAVGKLNQQSGELTAFKQRDGSIGNLPVSPGSHHGTFKNLPRRGKKNAPLFDNSNRDLGGAANTYSEGMFTTGQRHPQQKQIQRRRPQTTKQRPLLKGGQNKSAFNLKNDASTLTSVQDQYTINEAALIRPGNDLGQARGDSIFQQQINASGGDSDEEQAPPLPITAGGVAEAPTAEDPAASYHQPLPSEYGSIRTGTAPLALHNQNLSADDFNRINGLQSANLAQQPAQGHPGELQAPAQVANPGKVLMQVNRYVHPCERLPAAIKPDDLETFEADYGLDTNERIADYLRQFDGMLVTKFIGASDGAKSRIKRFQADYLPDDGCDSEDEEQLAYTMFVDDIRDIRSMVAAFLHDTLSGQVVAEKKFAKERDFFSEQVAKAKAQEEELRRQIKQITKDLEYEKDYNVQLFVDEQVTQMCQKAYFSFNLMTKENQLRQYEQQEGEDSKRRASAAARAGTELPNTLTGSAASLALAAGLPISPPLDGTGHSGSAQDLHAAGAGSVLDASVRMGCESKRQSQSLLTVAESQEGEQGLRKIIEDLRWKLDYEKRIGKEMVELLESRVASLLAQINTFQEEEVEQKATIVAQEEETERNQKRIMELSEELRMQRVENEKLEFKITELQENVVDKAEFEKVCTDLKLAESQVKFKTGRIAEQKQEIEQLVVIVKDLHLKVSITTTQEQAKQEELESYMDQVVSAMNRKIAKVNTLFQDTLRYSSKTYFYEEIQRHQRQNSQLKSRLTLLEKRHSLYDKQLHLARLRVDGQRAADGEPVGESQPSEQKRQKLNQALRDLDYEAHKLEAQMHNAAQEGKGGTGPNSMRGDLPKTAALGGAGSPRLRSQPASPRAERDCLKEPSLSSESGDDRGPAIRGADDPAASEGESGHRGDSGRASSSAHGSVKYAK